MLLYNKSKIVIKHKSIDKEYSITWKYNNKISCYTITVNRYVNGYLSPGYSKEFYLNSLDILENKLDNFVNIDNCIVRAY